MAASRARQYTQPPSRKDAQIAGTRFATLLACKGGLIREITVRVRNTIMIGASSALSSR